MDLIDFCFLLSFFSFSPPLTRTDFNFVDHTKRKTNTGRTTGENVDAYRIFTSLVA